MEKQQKLKYIKDLIYEARGWGYFHRPTVTAFIGKTKRMLSKIDGPNSQYINDIDVLVNKRSNYETNGDWQERIIEALEKLKFEIETEEDMQSYNKSLSIHCNKCNHPTNHNIIYSKTEREDFQDMHGAILIGTWVDRNVLFLKCGSCGEFAIRKSEIYSEDIPDFDETNIVILPKRGNASIKPAEDFKHVPPNLTSLYKEVVDAYVDEVNLLCAGGIRAIIEAICVNKGVKGINTLKGFNNSLEAKISGLFEQGYITAKHSEILHNHRYLGNEALHELQKPSSEELVIAIEIIAHTLSAIYELEIKGQELKNKRDQRKK